MEKDVDRSRSIVRRGCAARPAGSTATSMPGRYLTPSPVFYEVTMAMEQHTYSFPKVTPCDPRELREVLRAARRDSVASERQREADRAQRRPATVRRDG